MEELPPYPIPSTAIPCSNASLEIRYHSGNGRGVYAKSAIPRNTLIETSPLLYFTESQIVKNPLRHYTYALPGGIQALALGLGSMFNHRDPDPNVGWYLNRQEGFITYKTAREVEAGEELTIHYGDVTWMLPPQTAHAEKEENFLIAFKDL